MQKELVSKNNSRRFIGAIVIYMVILLVFILAVIFLYKNKSHMNSIAVVVIGLVAVGLLFGGFLILTHGTIRTGRYCCRNCNSKFVPQTKDYWLRPQFIGKCYMACPICKKKSWCKKIL